MSTDNFLIENSDIELAQDICKTISNQDIRNRAVANAVAANIASKYFESENFEIDASSGLHNIARVLEDIDISDIYINGNYFDVRVFFNEDEMCVPLKGMTENLLPTAYMFIKVNTDLSGASVLGFVNPERIDKNNTVDGYCRVTEDMLESFYDVEPLIVSNPEQAVVSDNDIFAFLDDKLDDKESFYAGLIKSKESRIRFARAAKAQDIFRFVSVNDIKNTGFGEPAAGVSSNEDILTGGLQDIGLDTSENIDLLNENNTEELIIEDTDLEQISDDLNDFENINIQEDTDELIENDNDLQIEEPVVEENRIEDNPDDLNVEDFVPDEMKSENDVLPPDASAIESEKNPEDEVKENTSFNYSTTTTPSLNESSDILDELSDFSKEDDIVPEKENSEDKDAGEQINALFPNGNSEGTVSEENDAAPGMRVYGESKKTNPVLPAAIVFMLLLSVGLGYYAYTKYFTSAPVEEVLNESGVPGSNVTDNIEQQPADDAMPVENVNITEPQTVQNEGVSKTIPAIEQNLDASILVSNLKVEWEVPAAYTSNTSAKRYLTKLGKVIQLNLKTELLLLNKPPITNKIAVELKYNSGSRKFEAVGITVSSGEKSVDDLILQTINKALSMNLSTNTDSFAKLHGNPVLIIHL